jgi:multidrug efflux system membrane fusion protein
VRDLVGIFLCAMSGESGKSNLGSKLARGLVVAAAALCAWGVAGNLKVFPRTEDAEVRANVAGVAPQVGGSIVKIHVVDNQRVSRGDLLFELDVRPYEAEAERARAQLELVKLEVQALRDAIGEAEAALADRKARADYSTAHYGRLKPLLSGNFASADRVQRAQVDSEAAQAGVREAEAALAAARNRLGEFGGRNTRIEAAEAALRDAELRVSYCKVYAPCDGEVVNLQISPGSYAAAGEQVFSILDSSVWFVLANFRETDLRRIKPGQAARVFVMSQENRAVDGIVQGIPKAVYPSSTAPEGTPGGEGIFARVRPTFDFVQLAQRFPVRIVLEGKGDFRMGGRAAVVVDTRNEDGLARLGELQRPEGEGFVPPAAK